MEKHTDIFMAVLLELAGLDIRTRTLPVFIDINDHPGPRPKVRPTMYRTSSMSTVLSPLRDRRGCACDGRGGE